MRKTKYRYEDFMLFDYEGIAAHLEKMAAKGWRFEKIGSFFWKYKKAEPAKVKYSVTFAPDASDFNPEPTERQRDMEEYCKEAGWVKVGSLTQMEIYCSENPDAVPVDTDEAMRLSITQKAMNKTFMTSHILLFFVFLLNTWNQFSFAERDMAAYLADDSKLWILGIIVFGFSLIIYEVLYYAVWLFGAKRAVAAGKACPSPGGYRVAHKIASALLVVFMLGLFASYNWKMMLFMLVYLAGYFGLVAAVNGVRNHLKSDGVSREGNIAITLTVDIVLAFALVFGLVIGMRTIGFEVKEKEPVGYYYMGNHAFEIYEDPIPLKAQDIIEEDIETGSTVYSYEAEESSTFLVSLGRYDQNAYGADENARTLYYQIITVKAKWLYDFLLEQFYESAFRYFDEDEIGEYRPVDMAVDDGVQVYRQYINGIPRLHYWLVCTEDKIISLRLDFEPTGEQIKRAVDKLVE